MNLITLQDSRSPVAEAYRTLRTNLEFANAEAPLRSVVVAAPTAEPDIAELVANLGVTFAKTGRKVILVEGDLRQRKLHTFFGLHNDVGLTSLVREGSTLEAALQESGVPNVQVLTAGPATDSPTDILDARQLEKALDRMHEIADWTLFTAPPLLTFSDGVILGHHADGILLVVRAGRTHRSAALRAKQILERVHVRQIGVAMLNSPVQRDAIDYIKSKG